MKYVGIVLHEVHDLQSNMDITFSKIFKKAKTLIKSIDDIGDIQILRIDVQ